jgi:hypothetical protein
MRQLAHSAQEGRPRLVASMTDFVGPAPKIALKIIQALVERGQAGSRFAPAMLMGGFVDCLMHR